MTATMTRPRRSAFSPLERLQRLDDEIATLHTKLTGKVEERKAILDAMIAEGNRLATESLASMTASRAANYVNGGRSFSDDQIRAIRAAHKGGESQCSIARRYGVSQPSIYKIVKREAYRDVS